MRANARPRCRGPAAAPPSGAPSSVVTTVTFLISGSRHVVLLQDEVGVASRWWTARRVLRRGRRGRARAAGRCPRGSPRRRGLRSPRPHRPRRRGRGSGCRRGAAPWACSSTTRPPWVWNSAGTTFTARTAERAAPPRSCGRTGRLPAPVGDRGQAVRLLRAGPRERRRWTAARAVERIAPDEGPALHRLPEVGEREAGVVDPLVEDDPALGALLAGELRGVLGVAGRLVAEPPTGRFTMKPPCMIVAQPDQRRATLRQRSVALVGVEERRLPRRGGSPMRSASPREASLPW